MKNRIYLDHAATTPLSKSVLDVMMPFLTDSTGNASAVYATGREARKAVEKARRQTAEAIGAETREILFTSGGSESDNLAIKGTAFALQDRGKHIITTAIEHPAVLNTCRWLEKLGFTVTYIQPDREGMINPESIRKAVRKDFDETGLNELAASIRENGLIQPISVRRIKGGFELIAGERRLKACKLIGKQKIEAIVYDIGDEVSAVWALIENLQRSDLSPFEEAEALFARVLDLELLKDLFVLFLSLCRSWRHPSSSL